MCTIRLNRRHPDTVKVLRRDIDEASLVCLVANEPLLRASVATQDPLQYLAPRNTGDARVRSVKGGAVAEVMTSLPGGCLGREVRVVEISLDR